jgi:RNA polymerase sigma-54 factor
MKKMAKRQPRITPSVQQAIALLSLSKCELSELLKNKLSDNPLVEEQFTIPFFSDVPLHCDLVIRCVPSTERFTVYLCTEGIPQVALRSVSGGSTVPQMYEKLYSEAAWLIHSIERRNSILKKVAEYVIEQQTDFLRGRCDVPMPLTLRKVAEHVGLHESTVSRVTKNKYLFTPKGILELRCLLSSDSATAEAVKHAIKDIICSEDPKRPLSDKQITLLLEKRGWKIARRTVAKHRDELTIPAWHIRRK